MLSKKQSMLENYKNNHVKFAEHHMFMPITGTIQSL